MSAASPSMTRKGRFLEKIFPFSAVKEVKVLISCSTTTPPFRGTNTHSPAFSAAVISLSVYRSETSTAPS